ncbi:hypothetical protein CTA2_12906, partial [Colletotrichum tanaceti]
MAHWSNIDITTCDRQLGYPLFSVIPGEIRNEIFALALIQYEDDKSAPGFKGPKRSSSALLRTCKLAYEEDQTAFLGELEFAFWFGRGPKGRTGNESCERFFNRLTMRQSCQLRRALTVTVRYSDWWHWEEDEPLRKAEDWLRGLRGPVALRELRVEYETLARKNGRDDQDREEEQGVEAG